MDDTSELSVEQGPQAWLAYLRRLEEGEPGLVPSTMLVLEIAAGLATRTNSVDWAEVALRAAALEAGHLNGVERDLICWRAMRLRATFISRMGSHSNHP